MWREPFHLQVAEEAETLFLVTEYHGTRIMLQPFCAEERETAAVEKIVAWFREQGQPCRFMGLEKSFAEKLAAMPAYHFELGTSENESDYVYLAEKLATLSGRKLHSKKNHLNAFRKLYPQAVYVPITEDILPACREVLDEWYQNRTHTTEKDDPFITTERKGILEVFDDWAFFGVTGGAIRNGGRIVAFTFGEQLNTDTAVVHVEKADPDMRGAFTAINQGYVEHTWLGKVTYINREEDMGLPGLRHAKESYKPVKRIEKFTATLKA